MNDEGGEVMLLNPRRRRRRKMTALQAQYFGGGRKRRRNAPRPARAVSRRRRSKRAHVGHYLRLNPRRRRNPSTGNIGSSIGSLVREAAAATVGIQANNAVGNALASKLLHVSGAKRSLVKVATAVLAPVAASMFLPKYAKLICSAGAAAIAFEASKVLNRVVYPQLGNVGNLLSGADVDVPAGWTAPNPAPARPFGRVGYNSIIDYPPGSVIPPDIGVGGRLAAYVPRAAKLSDEDEMQYQGIYGGGASVY